MKEMFTYFVSLFWFRFFFANLLEQIRVSARADFFVSSFLLRQIVSIPTRAPASARAYRMRTRRQAEPEQQDEPEEREEEIVYEVRENVDDLFEGYREGTKIIVVAFEVTRKTFFRKDERNNDGALRKRGSTPENLFRNFRKGKTGFMAKTFY